MSPKQWFALLAFFISYLFFGASVFYHFEQKLETDRREKALEERIEINEILTKYTAPDNRELQDDILNQVSDYCGKPVTNHTKDEFVDPYIWNFYHSFFFSFIVCSTVGYGNISPNNTFGRIFMIFYALVGIPVNGILFAYLGDFFGKTFIKLYRRYKAYKLSTDQNYVPRKINLIGQIILYLIPGIVFFIFIPAVLFTYFEDWDYSISVYYAFVTLTTIGFGDFVPTFQAHQERVFGIYFVFYQIFIIFWFIFGVGYLVMVMGFLARGLRSKRIKRIEHHLAHNLKETQHKIWHGVIKDVGYIRKILNEVYFLKFKPVYHDQESCKQKFQIPKSQSCPNLFVDDKEECDSLCTAMKQRAFSVCVGPKGLSASNYGLSRFQSDTDLTKIDKEKTFDMANAAVQPGELLAKVVVALSNIRADDQIDNRSNLGVHGFSDSQILASEQNHSNWSLATSEKSYVTLPIPQPVPFKHPRQRAISEMRIPSDDSHKVMSEWTWNGTNTKDIENMRARAARPREPKESLYKASLRTKLRYNSESVIDFPQELPSKATNKSFFNKLNPFKRKISDSEMKRHSLGGQELDPQSYFKEKPTTTTTSSYVTPPNSYISQTMSGRNSVLSMQDPEESNLLETTTIADLIRALEYVHTEANTNTSNTSKASSNDVLKPKQIKRKLGTDHLTPRIPSLLTLNRTTLNRRRCDSHHTFGTGMDTNIINKNARPRVYSCVTAPSLSSISHSDLRGPINDISPFAPKPPIQPLPPNPPPYTEKINNSPIVPKHRFSIRPSNLSAPPGQFHKQLKKRPSQPAVSISFFDSHRMSTSAIPSGTNLLRPLQHQPVASATNINEAHNVAVIRKRFERDRAAYSSFHNLDEIRLNESERKRNESS